MISGGRNGGEVPIELTLQVIAGSITSVMGTATLITTLIADMYNSYYDCIYSGNPESYMDTQDKAFQLFILGDFELIMSQFIFANYQARYLKKTGGTTGETSYGKSSLNSLKNTENFTDSAIEHIFEGQINVRGKAVGYHYEGINGSLGKIISAYPIY